MDVEAVYTEGPYRIVIGFSEEEQAHYARIEANTDVREVQWEYEMPQDYRGYPVPEMLAATQTAARNIIGIDQFEVDRYDHAQLLKAPYSHQVDPATLESLEMLDTDYAQAPIYGNSATTSPTASQQLSFEEFLHIIDYGRDTDSFTDGAPLEDLEQTVRDCLAELEVFSSCLKTYISSAQQPDAVISQDRLNSQCDGAIVFSAGQLVQINEALFRSFSLERIEAIASASESITATINDIYAPEEIERINAVALSLCGSKLTDFRNAVERGYDPVTGLPLNCPNPSIFSWENTAPDSNIELYQHYGLSQDEAQRIVDIQRTDPRYRTEDDWLYLDLRREMLVQQVASITERET